MLTIPAFKVIYTAREIDVFAAAYLQCSGFNVPRDYFENNQVFSISWHNQMIGGFVLGAGKTLRTLEVFVGNESREALYEDIQQAAEHTEMCCFWIEPAFRKKTWINLFVWLCVAYALQTFGTTQLIFGTNSVRLAALYSATPKCRLIHADYINNKQTFVFTGPRRHCLLGVGQILIYKFKRLAKISGKRKRTSISIFQKSNNQYVA